MILLRLYSHLRLMTHINQWDSDLTMANLVLKVGLICEMQLREKFSHHKAIVWFQKTCNTANESYGPCILCFSCLLMRYFSSLINLLTSCHSNLVYLLHNIFWPYNKIQCSFPYHLLWFRWKSHTGLEWNEVE